jgi:hypothetical protein
MANENNKAFHTFLGGLVIGAVLFYFGGWYIGWDEFISTKKSLYLGHGLAVEFNNRYYGLLFKPRFFDSAVISWVMGLISLSAISAGVKALNADPDDEDEDEDEDEKNKS